MAVLTRHRLVVALSLAALVAANLTLLTVGLWGMEEWAPRQEWFNKLVIGLLIGDIALIGVWFGLGDWRWYMRLPIAVALTITIARCFGWAGMLSRHSSQTEPDPSMMIAFFLLAMMLASAIAAFTLRRLRGWRLTWSIAVSAITAHQFQLADVMLWTILVSGGLAALRFLDTIAHDFGGDYVELAVFVLESTVLVLLALASAFAKRWSLKVAVLIAVLIFVIGTAGGIPAMWRVIDNWITSGTTPRPIIRAIMSVGRQVLEHNCLAMAAFYGTLLNGLTLRALGCRLVRPTGWNWAGDGLSGAVNLLPIGMGCLAGFGLR